MTNKFLVSILLATSNGNGISVPIAAFDEEVDADKFAGQQNEQMAYLLANAVLVAADPSGKPKQVMTVTQFAHDRLMLRGLNYTVTKIELKSGSDIVVVPAGGLIIH